MNAEALVEEMKKYGVDDECMRDRFDDDAELYVECLRDLVTEKRFSDLDAALEAKDYGAAFQAAHAVKGLAANLSITVFFESLSALVEALRASQLENIDALYATVRNNLAIFSKMLDLPLSEPEGTSK